MSVFARSSGCCVRVVFLCQADHAGNAFKASQAVNRVGRIEARHITCFKHPLAFAADIVFDSVCSWSIARPVNAGDRYEEACQILDEADLIHCWNDEYHDFFGWERSDTKAFRGEFPAHWDKYKSVTFTGTWYRQHYQEINKRLNESKTRLVVETPAFLGIDEIDPLLIPHAVDTSTLAPLPPARRDNKTIGVYPHLSTTANSDIDLLESVLKEHFPGWSTTCKDKMPHEQHLKRLARCQFFMQHTDCRMISYGQSAIEAMALGVPVFNSVCWQAKERWPDIPIFDIAPNESSIRQALENALSQDYGALSKRARQFVLDVHDYSVVGEKYTRFFEGLCD